MRAKSKGDDVEAIKASIDALMKVSHKMAEEMYKNAQAAGGAQQPGAEAQAQPNQGSQDAPKSDDKNDGPVDADFEVVDDK